MANEDYRTAHGFVYAGPYEKVIGEDKKPIVTYLMGALGLNRDVNINLDFFTDTFGPVDLNIGDLVTVSGRVVNRPGKDKDENEVTKHYMTVNKLRNLGPGTISTKSTGVRPAPKQRRAPAPSVNIEDEFE